MRGKRNVSNIDILEEKFSIHETRENSSSDGNSDVWFRISRLHFLPLNEMKKVVVSSKNCEIIEKNNSGNLEFYENHFDKSLRNSNIIEENIFDSTILEGRKLLSNSVSSSSLAKFECLSENASSIASDNCNSEKYLFGDRERIINNVKNKKRRKIIFCCLG